MEIINYKRGNDEGGILVNGKDQYIAVTVSTSKKFKSLRGAQKFLESYGYNPVKSQIGSSSAVDQYLENNPSARLAKITVDTVLRKDTDLTVRGLSSFTFSFEGDSPEAVRKIKRFFGRKAKIEGEYDRDTDTTYIYMDIPSKKNSIGGTQYRSKDRNSRAEVYPGGQDEYGRDLFRVELREDNGHVEELYMTKNKLNRWLDRFGFYPDIYDRFKDDFDEEDIDY